MAPFRLNVHGYEFQNFVDVLRKSAETGLAALRREICELERQLQDYRRVGEFEGERDDEGNIIWDQDAVLSHEIAFANAALMELRKAFAIAAYHLWERSAQRWIAWDSHTAASDGIDTRKKRRHLKHGDLLSAANNIGYRADPCLPHVVGLANALKHNSETYGESLMKSWPDIFPTEFQKPSRGSDWASAIQLTDRHLKDVFDIVAKSGPTTDSFPE